MSNRPATKQDLQEALDRMTRRITWQVAILGGAVTVITVSICTLAVALLARH